jgi:hypothetical protein
VSEAVTARVLRFTCETGAHDIQLATIMPKKGWRKVRKDMKAQKKKTDEAYEADGNRMMTGV